MERLSANRSKMGSRYSAYILGKKGACRRETAGEKQNKLAG